MEVVGDRWVCSSSHYGVYYNCYNSTQQRTSLAASYSKYLSIMQEIANDISKNDGYMKASEVERIITKIK